MRSCSLSDNEEERGERKEGTDLRDRCNRYPAISARESHPTCFRRSRRLFNLSLTLLSFAFSWNVPARYRDTPSLYLDLTCMCFLVDYEITFWRLSPRLRDLYPRLRENSRTCRRNVVILINFSFSSLFFAKIGDANSFDRIQKFKERIEEIVL